MYLFKYGKTKYVVCVTVLASYQKLESIGFLLGGKILVKFINTQNCLYKFKTFDLLKDKYILSG